MGGRVQLEVLYLLMHDELTSRRNVLTYPLSLSVFSQVFPLQLLLVGLEIPVIGAPGPSSLCMKTVGLSGPECFGETVELGALSYILFIYHVYFHLVKPSGLVLTSLPGLLGAPVCPPVRGFECLCVLSEKRSESDGTMNRQMLPA